MDATFLALQKRVYGTPITKYGRSISPASQEMVEAIYDGRLIPAFLLDNGGNYQNVTEFLRVNKLGSIFDLEIGQIVQVPQHDRNKFSVHPDA